MGFLVRYRFVIFFLLALLTFLFLPTSLASGDLALKVFERKIKIKEHSHLSAPICNPTDKGSNDFGLMGVKLNNQITYRVNPNVPASISRNLDTIVANSFETWSNASGVIFTRGPNTSKRSSSYDGQNIVAWNRLSRNTLGTTYIRYNPATGAVLDVDTIMNTRHPWSWTDPNSVNVDANCPNTNAYDAQNILVHEIGHWVGLEDLYEPSHEDLTMFGYASKNELKKDTLESGDDLGVTSLYGP